MSYQKKSWRLAAFLMDAGAKPLFSGTQFNFSGGGAFLLSQRTTYEFQLATAGLTVRAERNANVGKPLPTDTAKPNVIRVVVSHPFESAKIDAATTLQSAVGIDGFGKDRSWRWRTPVLSIDRVHALVDQDAFGVRVKVIEKPLRSGQKPTRTAEVSVDQRTRAEPYLCERRTRERHFGERTGVEIRAFQVAIPNVAIFESRSGEHDSPKITVIDGAIFPCTVHDFAVRHLAASVKLCVCNRTFDEFAIRKIAVPKGDTLDVNVFETRTKKIHIAERAILEHYGTQDPGRTVHFGERTTPKRNVLTQVFRPLTFESLIENRSHKASK